MSLVVFTGAVGLVIAPGAIHPVDRGGGGALHRRRRRRVCGHQHVVRPRHRRRDDAHARERPVPAGRVEPGAALGLGIVLSAGSTAMMGIAVNWVAAGLLAFTIFFYVVIYTMWLKRRTPQNIVIGGAAGAFPPMIGWAAVTGGVDLTSLALFGIIFLWTPPHFWALALVRLAGLRGRQGAHAAGGGRRSKHPALDRDLFTAAAARERGTMRDRGGRRGLRHRRAGGGPRASRAARLRVLVDHSPGCGEASLRHLDHLPLRALRCSSSSTARGRSRSCHEGRYS